MEEVIKLIGYYSLLFLGVVVLVQRTSLLMIDLLTSQDASIDQTDYILYKKYRTSDSTVIRVIGKVLDLTDIVTFGILKKTPLFLALVAGLVLVYVAYAIYNT